MHKNFKNILILVFFSLLICGCADWAKDWGLKSAAKRYQNSVEADSETDDSLKFSDVNAKAKQECESCNRGKEEIEKEVEEFFNSSGQDSNKEAEQNANKQNLNNDELGLISCDEINGETCVSNGQVVCAKIQAEIGGVSSSDWLEFESACAACKNRIQEAGENKLEVLGYKMGKCD